MSYATAYQAVSIDLPFGRASGGAGNDTLARFEDVRGGHGDDVLYGDDGENTIWGGDGIDLLVGLRGNDALRGDDGGDVIDGGDGLDYVIRGAGDDRIFGGDGDDRLTGGDGRDAFVFRAAEDGTNRITDFQIGTDRIDVTDLLDDLPGLGESYVGHITAGWAGDGSAARLSAWVGSGRANR
ncbi:MAG: type I secretion C-terminal target domain-containing protein [Pseudomonadota bacterium]